MGSGWKKEAAVGRGGASSGSELAMARRAAMAERRSWMLDAAGQRAELATLQSGMGSAWLGKKAGATEVAGSW